MTNFSVTGVPLILCGLTLVSILVSWLLQGQADPPLSAHRWALFRGGVILGGLGLVVTGSCFVDPFPLVQHPDGSLSITWLERAWSMAFLLAILSASLAVFGRGKARVLLIVSQFFSFLLTFASLLQNGV